MAQGTGKTWYWPEEKVLLFYGQVAPYKGLEYLVQSLVHLRKTGTPYRLLIAGRIKKNAEDYWKEIQETISRSDLASLILSRIEFIPDEETEIYFKAADALVLPYVYIFQSGVLFLSYNFGLPVLAADVGSLKENIVEGRTGFVFPPKDPASLARTIEVFFDSELYRNLPDRRKDIRELAVTEPFLEHGGVEHDSSLRPVTKYQSQRKTPAFLRPLAGKSPTLRSVLCLPEHFNAWVLAFSQESGKSLSVQPFRQQ